MHDTEMSQSLNALIISKEDRQDVPQDSPTLGQGKASLTPGSSPPRCKGRIRLALALLLLVAAQLAGSSPHLCT